MTARPLNSILKEICAQSLGRLLPSEGFEESPSKGRHTHVSAQYHQFAVDRLCVVDVQRDKYWTNQAGSFCVNLWILFPSAGDFSGMDVMTVCMMPGKFDVHDRLGRLATGSDYWWKLERGWFFSESRTVETLASDLREKWVSFGRPWFESIPHLRTARDDLSANWGKGEAISMSLALGEPAEARQLFIDLLCNRYRPPDDVLVRDMNRGLISEAEYNTLRRLLMQKEDTLRRGLEDLFGRSMPRNIPTAP